MNNGGDMGNKAKLSAGNYVKKYIMITVGTLVYAMAISLFLEPNRLAPGGVTGISIIINYYTGMATGTLVLLMNVPLLLIGIWKLGGKFFISTIVATGLVSVFIDIVGTFPSASEDRLVCAVFGGILMGISLGIIFKAGATTGGTDIATRLLKLKFPHIETGKLFISIDIFIVIVSAVAFRDIELAVYAGICTFISGKVFDTVLYGGEGAKLIFVISGNASEIAERFMTELKRGVTYVQGTGAYTASDKKIIMCALRKQQLPKAEDIIKETDINAFIIVTSANEIVGEGYKSPYEERI